MSSRAPPSLIVWDCKSSVFFITTKTFFTFFSKKLCLFFKQLIINGLQREFFGIYTPKSSFLPRKTPLFRHPKSARTEFSARSFAKTVVVYLYSEIIGLHFSNAQTIFIWQNQTIPINIYKGGTNPFPNIYLLFGKMH